jgi:hypothetical protein
MEPVDSADISAAGDGRSVNSRQQPVTGSDRSRRSPCNKPPAATRPVRSTRGGITDVVTATADGGTTISAPISATVTTAGFAPRTRGALASRTRTGLAVAALPSLWMDAGTGAAAVPRLWTEAGTGVEKPFRRRTGAASSTGVRSGRATRSNPVMGKGRGSGRREKGRTLRTRPPRTGVDLGEERPVPVGGRVRPEGAVGLLRRFAMSATRHSMRIDKRLICVIPKVGSAQKAGLPGGSRRVAHPVVQAIGGTSTMHRDRPQ